MMTTLIVVILLSIGVNSGYSQNSSCDSVYHIVDTMPRYGKGNTDLVSFVSENVKLKEKCIPSGKLIFYFTIDQFGNLKEWDVKGIEGTCKFNLLDQLKGMKQWTPGSQNGQPVCVEVIIPMYICF